MSLERIFADLVVQARFSHSSPRVAASHNPQWVHTTRDPELRKVVGVRAGALTEYDVKELQVGCMPPAEPCE
jgi:hypothetical protein